MVASCFGDGVVTADHVSSRFICGVCGASDWTSLDVESSAFPTRSRFPAIHEFENHVCGNCAVVATIPQIEPDSVARFYNSDYRRSAYALELDGKVIEPPLQIPWSGVSFQRFETFHALVSEVAQRDPEVVPRASDAVVDVGAYQGMFLHAVNRFWGCEGVACDYSESGIEFARRALGFERSFVVSDLMVDPFPVRSRFVSLVHVFEHLPRPADFLARVRDELLQSGGYLYLEVPNVEGHPLDDPTHVYMYNERTLRALLEACGFDVQALRLTGHPRAPFRDTFGSETQNIACIARSRGGPGTADWSTTPSPAELRTDIRRAWRRISAAIVGVRCRQAVVALKGALGRLIRFVRHDLRSS